MERNVIVDDLTALDHLQGVTDFTRVDGKLWAIQEGSVVVLNCEGEPETTLSNDRKITATCLLKRRAHVWVGYSLGMICVYLGKTGTLVHEANDHGHSTICALGTLEDRVFSSSEDGTVFAWKADTFDLLYTFKGISSAVRSFASVKKLLFTGSDEGLIQVWALDRNTASTQLRGHKAPVLAMCTSYGDTLWSGSEDHSVRVWNSSTFGCVTTLLHHKGPVTSVCNVGDFVLSGSNDSTICMWDSRSHQCIHTLAGHEGSILSVGFVSAAVKYQFWSTAKDYMIRRWTFEMSGGAIDTEAFNRLGLLNLDTDKGRKGTSITSSPNSSARSEGFWEQKCEEYKQKISALQEKQTIYDQRLGETNALLDAIQAKAQSIKEDYQAENKDLHDRLVKANKRIKELQANQNSGHSPGLLKKVETLETTNDKLVSTVHDLQGQLLAISENERPRSPIRAIAPIADSDPDMQFLLTTREALVKGIYEINTMATEWHAYSQTCSHQFSKGLAGNVSKEAMQEHLKRLVVHGEEVLQRNQHIITHCLTPTERLQWGDSYPASLEGLSPQSLSPTRRRGELVPTLDAWDADGDSGIVGWAQFHEASKAEPQTSLTVTSPRKAPKARAKSSAGRASIPTGATTARGATRTSALRSSSPAGGVTRRSASPGGLRSSSAGTRTVRSASPKPSAKRASSPLPRTTARSSSPRPVPKRAASPRRAASPTPKPAAKRPASPKRTTARSASPRGSATTARSSSPAASSRLVSPRNSTTTTTSRLSAGRAPSPRGRAASPGNRSRPTVVKAPVPRFRSQSPAKPGAKKVKPPAKRSTSVDKPASLKPVAPKDGMDAAVYPSSGKDGTTIDAVRIWGVLGGEPEDVKKPSAAVYGSDEEDSVTSIPSPAKSPRSPRKVSWESERAKERERVREKFRQMEERESKKQKENEDREREKRRQQRKDKGRMDEYQSNGAYEEDPPALRTVFLSSKAPPPALQNTPDVMDRRPGSPSSPRGPREPTGTKWDPALQMVDFDAPPDEAFSQFLDAMDGKMDGKHYDTPLEKHARRAQQEEEATLIAQAKVKEAEERKAKEKELFMQQRAKEREAKGAEERERIEKEMRAKASERQRQAEERRKAKEAEKRATETEAEEKKAKEKELFMQQRAKEREAKEAEERRIAKEKEKRTKEREAKETEERRKDEERRAKEREAKEAKERQKREEEKRIQEEERQKEGDAAAMKRKLSKLKMGIYGQKEEEESKPSQASQAKPATDAQTLLQKVRSQHSALMARLEALDNSDSESATNTSCTTSATATPIQRHRPKKNKDDLELSDSDSDSTSDSTSTDSD